MPQTKQFRLFVRGVAQRRFALLKDRGRIFLPRVGDDWLPTNREKALCDSYVVFFVAELETYLEGIVDRILALYASGMQASVFSVARPAADYVKTVSDKRAAWSKNNNTNWSRIEDYIKFIGFGQADFPEGLWDHIEFVAKQRGGLVHQSVGAQTFTDPRITIDRCKIILNKIKEFDNDVSFWIANFEGEVRRLSANPLRFQSGFPGAQHGV